MNQLTCSPHSFLHYITGNIQQAFFLSLFFWLWTPLTPFPLTVHACLFVLFPLCCGALCCNKRTPFVWDAGFEQLQAARHRAAEMRGDIQQSTNNEGTPLRLKISLVSCFLLSDLWAARQSGVVCLLCSPSTSFASKKPTITSLSTSSYHYQVYRALSIWKLQSAKSIKAIKRVKASAQHLKEEVTLK